MLLAGLARQTSRSSGALKVTRFPAKGHSLTQLGLEVGMKLRHRSEGNFVRGAGSVRKFSPCSEAVQPDLLVDHAIQVLGRTPSRNGFQLLGDSCSYLGVHG